MSKAFRRCRFAPLSTPYPPMTLESSLDSASERKEHMEIGITDVEAVADSGIGDGVGAPIEDGIGMRVEIAASDIKEDEEEFEAEASAVGTREIDVDPLVTGDISKPTIEDYPDMEIPVGRIADIKTAQRQLEVGQLIAEGERASLTNRVRSLIRKNQKV
nr:hypothetical protein [Tanacetum cinerariifolium]